MLSSTEPAGAGLCAHGRSQACGQDSAQEPCFPHTLLCSLLLNPLCFRAFITLVPEITF